MCKRTKAKIASLKERLKVMNAYLKGSDIQYSKCGFIWRDVSGDPGWWEDIIYRIKPKAKPTVHWDMLDEKFKFVAFDYSDTAFAYLNTPRKSIAGWASGGHFKSLEGTKIAINQDKLSWQETLVERPQ